VRGVRVAAVRRLPVGGARLDAEAGAVLAVAGVNAVPGETRRVREALSLLPEVRAGSPPAAVHAADLRGALAGPLAAVVDAVVASVAAAGPDPPPLVLLIGGVARTPLLAELLDAAGVGDVRVAERPDAAAVTGALLLPAALLEPATVGPATVGPSRPGVSAGRSPGRHGSALGAAPANGWLPPVLPARHHRTRAVLGALGAVAGVAGLLAAGAALPPSMPPSMPPSIPPSSPPSATSAAAGDLVQYGYAVRLPAGWAHTGGLPERRRSLITPSAAPDGTDLISVERTPLGYDADTEPRRARAELRAEFAAAVEGGAPLSGFDDEARYAGRSVVAYREAGGATAGDVDWYVVLDGDAQLSVGCRHTPAGTESVVAACATVVGSLRRTS
jgi:type VII secretion-associated protein (TIGR03931 family)